MIDVRGYRRTWAVDLGWQAFTPLEALALGFVVFAVAVAAVFGAPVGRFLWIGITLAAALAILSLAVVKLTRIDLTLGRWLAGIALTFCVYGALPPWLDGLAGPPIDGALKHIERAMIGASAAELLAPMASDGWTLFFALAYALHVPLFFVTPILHWRAGRRDRAERLLLNLALAMYAGFVLYALFPALGPIAAFDGLPPLGTNLATETVATYAVALGTFPSLHGGVSAAVAMDAWRHSNRWGLAFTLVAALIWFATLYLRYHWLPDLLAGVALVLVTDQLARHLRVAWPKERLP